MLLQRRWRGGSAWIGHLGPLTSAQPSDGQDVGLATFHLEYSLLSHRCRPAGQTARKNQPETKIPSCRGT